MPSRFLSLILVSALAFTAHAHPRRRAVSPADRCTYSVSAAALPDPVPEVGVTRAPVAVAGTGPSCRGWITESPADWITIEGAEGIAYVSVAPNPGVSRSATIRIASALLTVTQAGTSVVSPPFVQNLIRNGSFHLDLAEWSWPDRFPNGTGDAAWSSFDVDGNIASGSIRLRDDLTSGPAYQQGQCVDLAPGVYELGLAVRAESATAVEGIIALVPFTGAGCTGSYPAYPVTRVKPVAGEWKRITSTQRLTEEHRSVLVVIGGYARQAGLQTVWLDDVYVRPR
jgi:hypothetical protein